MAGAVWGNNAERREQAAPSTQPAPLVIPNDAAFGVHSCPPPRI